MDTRATNLLIIEDNPADARLIKELIAETNEPFQIKSATRLEEGVALIRKNGFDAILLDLSLPDSHGLETFLDVNKLTEKTAVLILTGLADQSIATEAVQAGAQDYLVKGTFESETLLRAIRYATERQRLFNKIKGQKAELETKNKALDQFAHTLAHQVKGVLTHSLGYASYAQLYFAEMLDDEFREVVNQIHRSNQKMANMVDELLLLASTRKGEVPLQKIDMGLIVREVQRRLGFEIAQAGAQITTIDEWPDTYGHAPWVEEVWVNYISNGLKYGGSPPVLTLGYSDEKGGMIRFWINDNGAGISPEAQKKLFKPHSRLLQHRVRGEGLGLSVVRQIVRRCGGEVGVNSRDGDGSTFWFTLPTQNQQKWAYQKDTPRLQQTELLSQRPDHHPKQQTEN